MLFMYAVLLVGGFRSAAHAAVEYTADGTLSAHQEQVRWFLNRARYSPEAEADRLGLNNTTPGGHPNFDVGEDTDGANDFGTTTSQWQAWKNSKPPLAANALLSQAASLHSRDMAETRLVQHASPSGNYFTLNSSTFSRHQQVGYANQVYGYTENIAYGGTGYTTGYPAEALSPQTAHERLYIDTGIADRGHRKCILNAVACEIGLGFWRSQAPEVISGRTYYMTRDYYTQDPGLRAGWHFFTDTAWYDADRDGVYDQNEGVGGLQIRLYQNGVEGAWFDTTPTGGGFAVPIAGFTDGAKVEVRVFNPGATAKSLTIPVGYSLRGDVSIPSGATLVLGTFTQPVGDRNTGMRDVLPAFDFRLQVTAGQPQVTFNAYAGALYRIEACTSLLIQDWSLVEQITADQARESVNCPGGQPCGFIRLGLLRD